MNNSLDQVVDQAKNGNADAQLLLGFIYQYGDDGAHQSSLDKKCFAEIDLKLAEKWYLEAAEQNLPQAQYNLARLYEDQIDVLSEPCFSKALYWYLRAAKLGDVDAQISVAEYYEMGNGCEKNLAVAIYWFHIAADNGWSYAKFKLAFYYATGQVVAVNYKRAVELYQQADKDGVIYAAYELARIYELGQWVEADLQQSVELYLKSASYNYIPALVRLAKAYTLGELGLDVDQTKLVKILEQIKLSNFHLDRHSLEFQPLNAAKFSIKTT